jgi:predicted RNA binding protein YcfA (HicA-like mRNA interferase family)
MKIPRDLSGRAVVKALCKYWDYRQVHQEGSHIILQADKPFPQRLPVPDHSALRIGTLNSILRLVAIQGRRQTGRACHVLTSGICASHPYTSGRIRPIFFIETSKFFIQAQLCKIPPTTRRNGRFCRVPAVLEAVAGGCNCGRGAFERVTFRRSQLKSGTSCHGSAFLASFALGKRSHQEVGSAAASSLSPK